MIPRIVRGQHHFRDDALGVYVYADYNEALVGELKAQIPWGHRRWDPEEKAWWISEEWAEWATDLVRFHFGAYEVVDEDGVIEFHESDGTVSIQGSLF